MAIPHEYFLSVINKQVDEDKSFGVQCVDLFKNWCRTVGGFDISRKAICNPTGYATSIWDNFDSLGLNKYFDKVPVNQMVDGDWAIWSKCSTCPDSHIAMFRVDNGNGTGVFLGQNQKGHPEATQMNFSYSGIRGALRPKIYHQAQQNPNTTQYINLSPQADTWNWYNIGDAPVKKNARGQLKPSKFGGLSYTIKEFRDNGTTVVVQGATRGLIKIYIKHELAEITNSPKYGLVN